jgi:hypothetical protein
MRRARSGRSASERTWRWNPAFVASAVAQGYLTSGGSLGIEDLVESLRDRMAALRSGEMCRAEEMLFAQAHALQSIFLSLATRAVGQGLELREANLRMALRAQNQCRMTLETLSTIKNPAVLVARQTNIAHGPQQVNNGTAAQTGTRARAPGRKIRQNELLEDGHGQRLDQRAPCTASDAGARLETVGASHRPTQS